METTRKVIIADESREFAVPCASLLKSFGVEAVLVPKDGEALYEAIVAQRPQAVLCDVFMPHSDAIGVMKRVREEEDLPQPQFMVLSGFDNVMLQNEVMRSGGAVLFSKPFDPEVLAERVVQLLGSAAEENGKNVKAMPFGTGGQDVEMMVTEMIHQIGVPAYIKRLPLSAGGHFAFGRGSGDNECGDEGAVSHSSEEVRDDALESGAGHPPCH